MNGHGMNQPPHNPQPPQGPEMGPDFGRLSGAPSGYETPMPENRAAEQTGPPTESFSALGKAAVGTSDVLHIHQKKFEPEDVGKVTGAVGEKVQTGEWRMNPQGKPVPVMRNRFVNYKLRGVGPEGKPIWFPPTEIPIDQSALITSLHNESRAAAKARTNAPEPLPQALLAGQAAHTEFIPHPAQGFGPIGAEASGFGPQPKGSTAEPVQNVRRQHPSESKGPEDPYHDPYADVESELPAWHLTSEQIQQAEAAAQQQGPQAGQAKQKPASQPGKNPNPNVGGAAAARQAERRENAEQKIQEGGAAVLGENVVDMNAWRDDRRYPDEHNNLRGY